ncbi:MAG: hypothetical protein ACFUZC_22410 [Chthoniobacteraceae bacterium]
MERRSENAGNHFPEGKKLTSITGSCRQRPQSSFLCYRFATANLPHLACFGAIFCLFFFLGFVKAAATDCQDDTFKIFPDPAGHAYFPKGRESFYTAYLKAMGEPSLMMPTKPQNDFALRFTWLRSFHDPIVIRIWQQGDHYQIRAVQLEKQKDDSPGPISKDQTRQLTKREVSQIKHFLRTKEFWKPLNEVEATLMSGGCDGSKWIFEQADKQKFQMIDLWSPTDFSPEKPWLLDLKKSGLNLAELRDFTGYSQLGLYLLKITNLLPPKKEDIY